MRETEPVASVEGRGVEIRLQVEGAAGARLVDDELLVGVKGGLLLRAAGGGVGKVGAGMVDLGYVVAGYLGGRSDGRWPLSVSKFKFKMQGILTVSPFSQPLITMEKPMLPLKTLFVTVVGPKLLRG